MQWAQGDEAALERLVPLVHRELHRIARRCMAGERAGHSLQATALVNEAYVRLVDARDIPWHDRSHFLAVAAREVLERLYGRDGHDVTFAAQGLTLHYTTFEAITNDVDDARVFGGIHFRFDQDAGAVLGRRVGAYVYEHNLRPARE